MKWRPSPAQDPTIFVKAVNRALAFELEHDYRVVILGEDVGVNSGVFRATAGLQTRFGADRVRDTPLAEA